eukprot:403337513
MQNFSVEQIFYIIDAQNKNEIDSDSLINFLKLNGIIWEFKEAMIFIDEFDSFPKDGRLKLEKEFRPLFETLYYLPQSSKRLDRQNQSQRSQVNSQLQRDVSGIVAKFIESQFLNILQKQQFKDQMFEGVSDEDLFEILNVKEKKGLLFIEDLEELLVKHKLINMQSSSSNVLLQHIMKRVDTNGDQKIDLQDFKHFINHNVQSKSLKDKDEEYKTINSIRQIYDSQESMRSPNHKQSQQSLRLKQNQSTIIEQQKSFAQDNQTDKTKKYSPLRQKKAINNLNNKDSQMMSSPLRNSNRDSQKYLESPQFGQFQSQIGNKLRINEDSPEKKRLDEDDYNIKKTFSQPFFDQNHTSNLLLDVLLKIIAIEVQIEEKRENCADQRQFNLYETFRYFDSNSRGYVYVKDVHKGLQDLGMSKIQEDEVYQLFKRYDIDQDGTLKFSEFSYLFEPIDEEKCGTLLNRRPESLQKEFKEYMFSYKAKLVLTEFLNKLIEGQKELTKIKAELKQISSAQGLGFKSLFNLFDDTAVVDGYVSEESLIQFFEKQNVQVSALEVALLLKVFDRDRDSLIKYDEFFGVLCN